MNDRDDLERRLEAWLEESAQPMPEDLFDEIVATAPRVPRAGITAAFPSGGRWRLGIAGLAAVVVVAVAVAAALRVPLGPGVGGSPAASSPVSPPLKSNLPTEVPRHGEWHRNNYNAGEEKLFCREGTAALECNYHVPDGTGAFSGQNVTGSWTCPSWFPSTICDNVTAVYRGTAWYGPLEGEPGPTSEITMQEYVITKVGGQEVLQLYWLVHPRPEADAGHVCPWYRTYEEALAAPYECVMAP